MGTVSKKQFAINAASGFAVQATIAVVGFVLMPYAIWRLGHEAYGVYQLAQSSLNFFLLLQLGMGPTLIRFCAQAVGSEDSEAIAKISSTGQAILGTLGACGMVLMLALIPFFLRFYEIPPEMRFETSGMLACMAMSLFLNMAFIVPQGIVLGCNRYDLANATEIVAHLLRLGLVIATFELLRPSVLILGLCILSTQAFRFAALYSLAARHLGRAAFFSPRRVCRKTFHAMAGFSVANVINTAAYWCVSQAPVLVIGKTMGAQAVTMFAPAMLIGMTIQGVLAHVCRPLVPVASYKRKDNKALGRISLVVSQGVVVLGLTAVLPLSLFGRELLGYWLGQELASQWLVVSVMAFAAVMGQSQSVNLNLALGASSIKPFVASQVALAITMLTGLTVGCVVFDWNLLQVSLFILSCRCLRNVGYLSLVGARLFHYDYLRYLVRVYLKPCAIFSLFVALGYVAHSVIGADSYVKVGGQILLIVTVYMTTAWVLLLENELKLSVKSLLARMVLSRPQPGSTLRK